MHVVLCSPWWGLFLNFSLAFVAFYFVLIVNGPWVSKIIDDC